MFWVESGRRSSKRKLLLFIHVVLPGDQHEFRFVVLFTLQEAILIYEEVDISLAVFPVVGEVFGVESCFKQFFSADGCFSGLVEVFQ